MRVRSTSLFSGPLLLLALILRSTPLSAQAFYLTVPFGSQRASVTQTIGLTDISVTYDRPAVEGRKIWGGLVPYDSVWRAGANVNTVIAFTSPVTIGGKQLPAGRYGLFMIPTAQQWTVILSREANAWGHFSYNEAEDALRFAATPVTGAMTERLEYTLDDPKADAVTVTLRWEKLALPFLVSVNSTQVVMDSLQQQLRGLPKFFPDAWRQAAAWALQHDQLAMASAWADTAIGLGATYQTLMLKSRILARQGDAAGADSLKARAFSVATEADMNAYGYMLMQQGKKDEALAVFLKNTKTYPQSWNTWDSLAECYGVMGDKKQAIANYQKALAMVGDPAQKRRIEGAIAALNKT
jgi:tetratricopeptide (TPR) repeat protein